MVDRKTKLRWRRVLRRRKKQVVEIGSTTEQALEKQLIKRLVRLPNVQRFLVGWIGLLFVLSVGVILQARAVGNQYQDTVAKPGGTYTEGLIGSFSNANPLFASSTVDSSVSRLTFASLLKYDNDHRLVGDMAESWTYDESETIYTVKLRPDLKWHDGKPLTAKDVAFTYQLIQNPETKSYLYPSWQNIKVRIVDDKTITFTLPNSLSPFPHSLTNGIVPEHVLKPINPSQLRLNSFNNQTPIGSGPFKFSKVEIVGESPEERTERIALNAYDDYHHGKPKLDSFVIRTFKTEKELTDAFNNKKLNAMAGISSLPEGVTDNSSVQELAVPLTGEVLVFFKTTHEALKDLSVRKALVLGTNKKEIFDALQYPLISVDQPFLESHIGYDKSLKQITGKPEDAKKMLEEAGWKADSATGIRAKENVKLSFKLYSQSTSEYAGVSGVLQRQWRDLGVDLQVELQNDKELQSTLALHNYDALLHGVSVGADPDVFAYWHSTQADPRSRTRLNFSEYKSVQADRALEAGRTRSEAQIRTVKYKPFLEAWRNDAPALALYQPRFLYVVHTPLYGFNVKSANSAADRYAQVEQWMAREQKQ